MRGAFTDQGQLFSYISPEARVRTDHPLRKIRELVRDVLGELNRSLSRLYACEGRPSIPPEQLLSALLLQVFYGIRSERHGTSAAVFCMSSRAQKSVVDFTDFDESGTGPGGNI